MGFEIQLPPERLSEMKARGLWPDRLLTDYLDDAVRARPGHSAVTGYISESGESVRLSYAELSQRAERIALGLVALGVEPGEVVSFQLPNCWQFTALHLACVRIGAVSNPLMPIFRQRELRFMLNLGESKVVVVPRSYRGFDYPGLLAEVRGEVPSIAHGFVIGGEGEDSFEGHFLERPWEDEIEPQRTFTERRPGPDQVTLLLYTSGTTGEPKGVMHTANTLMGNARSFIARVGLGADDTTLMASPLAHLTGFLYGMAVPIVLGGRSVLQDVWAADVAARIIQEQRVTFTMASTPFLSDLTETAALEHCDVGSLHTFLTAGAPIPRVLVQRASERLGALVISCWGMTENGAATTTRRDDPPDKVFGTDGMALEGLEVRVVGGAGEPLPPGREGRLQARGMSNFVGYLKRPELFATDAEGWFETGDLATMDEDGYIRITGRAKDVIIRGGENIPVVEVEQLLHRHPAIQDVAVVAMPDARLGERGCAFATLKPGHSLSFTEMAGFLEEQQMARTYLPEQLEIIDEMPRTPSGKIQKFQLREIAKGFKPEN
jgi:cyclohexanecarboxylate-CoA ligase